MTGVESKMAQAAISMMPLMNSVTPAAFINSQINKINFRKGFLL
jgi:hypothetical protein